MTNLEERPAVHATGAAGTERGAAGTVDTAGAVDAVSAVEVLEPRDVPLGGPRAMTVRRTLPQRGRSLIGAWCFVDAYGPDDVGATGGMRVPGHPHTGLQTVTWLFEGEVEHRDTAGTLRVIRPGEVNLMTAGSGIAHSEYSTADTRRLHGAQLWIALPDARRGGPRAFESYAAPQFAVGAALVRVFLGELEGARSPVTTWTALVGAEVLLPASAAVTLTVDPRFEHGLLIDGGVALLDGTPGEEGTLLYRPAGADRLELRAGPDPVRLLLIGGEPLGEPIVMWWNFVARSHEEIVRDRTRWQAQLARLGVSAPDGAADDPYGAFPDAWTQALPAPEMPQARLRPRAGATGGAAPDAAATAGAGKVQPTGGRRGSDHEE